MRARSRPAEATAPTRDAGTGDANQLTQWGTATLTYDANGNMLSNGTDGYTWDARNRLVSTLSGAVFQYDSFGRRTSKTLAGTTTSLVYDGANVVQELVGGIPTANLVSAGTDEVFIRTDSAGPRYFLTDALGSTLGLTDAAGTLQTQYTYEPFGQTTMSGAGSSSSYQYTGRENDGTGLYFYRARHYNPTYQRFISEDPERFAAGVPNFYAYVRNSPPNMKDPTGLQAEGCVIGLPFGGLLGCGIGIVVEIIAGVAIGAAIGAALDRAIPRAPTKPKEKCGRQSRCDLVGVGPGYCIYQCQDGATVRDASCIPFFYKPWGENFPREYPDFGK